MSTNLDTGIEERNQWRERILRALAELRGDDVVAGLERNADGPRDERCGSELSKR